MTLFKDIVVVGAMSAFQYFSTAALSVVEVIRGLDELDKLRPIWDELTAGSNSPMHGYAWVRACAEKIHTTGDQLHFLVIKASSPPTLAPLVQRRGKQNRLELLGVHALHEPMDFSIQHRPCWSCSQMHSRNHRHRSCSNGFRRTRR